MTAEPVVSTDLAGIPKLGSGKVRDIYDLDGQLLIVATDRISAFDVVLGDTIPDKGRVLTQLSAFWFERFRDLVSHHMVTIDPARFPDVLAPFRDFLAGRSMLVRRAQPLPVECVVRGYLAGTGWKDYLRTGSVCGIPLPAGMRESERLSDPIFTPSTKAATGHDQNITREKLADLVGAEPARQVAEASLRIYSEARTLAEKQGIIIADTKLEFGLCEGKLLLIDEVLTPDSSRFWSAADYRPGISPPSFDKQFVRNFLDRIGWNKIPPAPELPQYVIDGTRQRYLEAFRRLTGRDLA